MDWRPCSDLLESLHMAYVSCRWETKKGEQYPYSFVLVCRIGACGMTFRSSEREFRIYYHMGNIPQGMNTQTLQDLSYMWDLRIIQRLKITWQERLGKVPSPFCLFSWAPWGSTVTHRLFYLQCNISSFKPAKAYSKYRKTARESSMLAVSSFVTLSEWFIGITGALPILVLFGYFVWAGCQG